MIDDRHYRAGADEHRARVVAWLQHRLLQLQAINDRQRAEEVQLLIRSMP
jgi:hypothetical protein